MRVAPGRTIHWPAVGLAVQLIASETDPNRFPARTAVRYTLFAIAALLPIGVVLLRSTSLPHLMRRGPLAWLAAYLAWTVVATVWSIDPAHAMQPALWTVSLGLYAAWYVAHFGWESFRRVMAVAFIVFLAVGWVAPESMVGTRLQGLTFGPTNLGLHGGLAVVFGASLPRRTRRDRTIALAAVALGLSAVVASSTRTVAIGLLLVAAHALVRRHGRSGTLVVIAGFVALALTFAAAADGGLIIVSQTPDGTDFVEERNGALVLSHTPGSEEYTTATGRDQVWRESIRVILQRPIFGWGTGSAERVFEEAAAQGRLHWAAYTTHNSVLGIILAQGMIGLALMLAAAASYWVRARRAPDLARTSLLVLLIIDGFSETLFETGRSGIIIVAAAFASVVTSAVRREHEERALVQAK